MATDDRATVVTPRRQLAAVVVAAVLLGVVFAPSVYGAASDTGDTVAVVEIEGPVTATLADDVESELAEIRANGSVGAVVLKLDTPGGAPAASERMYKAVQRTSRTMPVIASVQATSASGGYYAMAPADDIYVLPTSVVGSIGLNAPAPAPREPIAGPSGPDKVGTNEIEGWARQQTLADTFVNAMMAERGEEFELSRAAVAEADVYLGREAVQNGYADEIGSLTEAVHEAATRAELGDYRVDTRETGPDSRFPILVRTDTQAVAVYATDPGYGEVKPMGLAYVHLGSVPHVTTVAQVTASDLPTTAGAERATDTAASSAEAVTRPNAPGKPDGGEHA